MTQKLFYTVFNTTVGWVGLLGSNTGLLRTTLPQSSEQEAGLLLGDSLDRAALSPQRFEDLIRRFRAYFDGRKVDFPDRLDLSVATSFQRRVWQAARLIPCGETRSYGWVAGQIGQPEAVRAVGQALGRNPLPVIVPCHRVLMADGGLGGFSGGIETKKFLLSLEGVTAE
ncbi:MAG: methylated-DNA--[protein]-cysteine S-methyltransferase [Dehalococcoidales bacterium]|nr:methylated-DNA--[protein]-cysteine S-methyltransferase [Dehalococcoidales bacterium]